MKFLTTLTALALAFFITGCDEKKTPDDAKESSNAEGIPYVGGSNVPLEPQTLHISNQSGKTIKVRVIGHDSHEVLFVRLSDNKTFRWKIDQLSPADQKIIRKLPVTANLSANYQNLENSPYIANRRTELHRLNEELRDMNREYEALQRKSRNGINPEIRGLQKQIAAKTNEIGNYSGAKSSGWPANADLMESIRLRPCLRVVER